MDKIDQYIRIALYVLLVIFNIVIAIRTRKPKIKTENSNQVENEPDTLTLVSNIISSIENAEDMGKKISGKSGFFKYDYVLNRAKEYCSDNGFVISNEKIKAVTDNLVNLLNYNKNSTQVENIKDDNNNILKGVQNNES